MNFAPTNGNDDMGEASSSHNGLDENAIPDSALMAIEKSNRWRSRVGHLLLATMVVAVVITTFFLLNEQENENFETAFHQFAWTLGDAALNRQVNLKISIQALASAISVYGETSEEEWPFVNIPMFESFAQDHKAISLSEYVAINNVVHHKDREAFVNYSSQHYQTWTQSGHLLAYGNLDQLDQNVSKYQPFISAKTKNNTWIEDIDRDVYYAQIVRSPPNTAYGPTINWNMASTFNANITEALVQFHNETLFSQVRPFLILSDKEHHGYHTNNEQDHPHTFVFQPVYRNVKDPSSEIVSVVVSAFAWDASMLNLIPQNVHGLVCVVKNSCEQAYTYVVNGHDAIYQGEGDLHDTAYDYIEVAFNLTSYSHPNITDTPNYCLYSMSVYPTQVFQASYNSNTPEVYAGIVAATFVVAALLFLIYDTIAQRRNKKLAKSAARSNAVLDSLFPGEFRDKVLEQHSVDDPSSKPQVRSGNTKWMVGNNRNGSIMDLDEGSSPPASPLAECYPETTVLFADLAGFTAWSSTREPAQVFELLETFYEAFDAIANYRRVYKIETVGDCYVAVTGLPKPQAEHALIMVKFARDCMNKMNTLTSQLVDTLGDDTLHLKLRVGLNSGPVTGGVLRGNKSRFQLFGDTMNTASRMESNGVPGRIHVSQSTADCIIASGKAKWIVVREEKITAKGKGEMQTYFVNPDLEYTATAISSTENSVGLDLKDLGEVHNSVAC